MNKPRPSVNNNKKIHPRKVQREASARSKHAKRSLPDRKLAPKATDGRSHAADAHTLDASLMGAAQESASEEGIASRIFTRRNFLVGAAGVAAICGIGAIGSAIESSAEQAEIEAQRKFSGDAVGSSTSQGDMAVLNVPEDAVFTTEQCEYIDDAATVMGNALKVSLPFGTIVHADDDSFAACLLPTDDSTPLTQVGLLALSNGNFYKSINQPVGAEDGFQIYDVRANSNGILWVESYITTGEWRVYHARLTGVDLGEPVMVASGGNEIDMPAIAISGDWSFWQLMPNASLQDAPKASKANTTLMRARIGASADEAETMHEAKGYSACAPSGGRYGVTAAVRSTSSASNYELLHFDAESGEITDVLTLPSSMKPAYVSYGDSGFSFSFEGIYNYGGGIANLGTYTPVALVSLDRQSAYDEVLKSLEEEARESDLDEDERFEPSEEQVQMAERRAENTVADLYSASEWFRFPRAPLTTPAWYKGWFLVKSTNVVAGVDMAQRRYFTLSPSGDGESYGEFLASTGPSDRIVTYANLNYTPINGDPVKECAVRIWS